MQTSVTFKNLDPSETIRSYVSNKLNRFDKFLYSPAEANVVLSVEKFRHIAEVNIKGDRMTFVGKEETDDMYSAIDIVLDKIEKQIKRGKQKFRERRSGNNLKRKAAYSERSVAADDDVTQQIHIKNIDYKPMDVEEAIMQMELINDSFLVFTNAKSERVNVLYRRKDGNFGLIQPSS
jgi:putative sigma-54 modulation protein